MTVMRTTLYNERAAHTSCNGGVPASSSTRTSLNRPLRPAAQQRPAATEQRRAAVTQRRKAEHLRDAQSRHLGGDDDDDDESAWPAWEEQPMPKQRAQARTRAQLKPLGSTHCDEAPQHHPHEAGTHDLARIDRKIEEWPESRLAGFGHAANLLPEAKESSVELGSARTFRVARGCLR